MNRPSSIQLDITTPCHEDWANMTACGHGRHCAQCNKTVIDFTTWSDTALYDFFAKDRGNVCGRLTTWQLNRPIHIPPQPHSRLYRMVVAMGLTLIFAQGADVYAQSRPPMVDTNMAKGTVVSDTEQRVYELAGNVLDDKKQPIAGATIQVLQDGVLKGETTTDFDGNYIVKPLGEGVYEAKVVWEGRLRMRVTDITLNTIRVTQNMHLYATDTVTVIQYKQSLTTFNPAMGLDTFNILTITNPPLTYQGAIGPSVVSFRGRINPTLYVIDGVQVYETKKEPPNPATKNILLQPGHQVYNMDEVKKLNIR